MLNGETNTQTMASNSTSRRHRHKHNQTNITTIDRTNFFVFISKCPNCTDKSICSHTSSIIIEPKLKKTERRPRFGCLVCQEVPTSAKKLVKHLSEEHKIGVNFRCAECKKPNFKSFRSVTAHQQHCANLLPDPVPKEPGFVPTSHRPPLGIGILSDISLIDDEPFMVIATKVLFRTATIDQLLHEFIRLVGKKHRPRTRQKKRRSAVNVLATPEADTLWQKDRKRMWNNLIKGNINPELDMNQAFEFFNANFGTHSANRLTPIQVHPQESIDINSERKTR